MNFLMRAMVVALLLAGASPVVARSMLAERPEIDPATLPQLSEAQSARLLALIRSAAGDWLKLETMRARTPQARYLSEDSELLLYADGQFARISFDTENPESKSEPSYALLGAWAFESEWLQLKVSEQLYRADLGPDPAEMMQMAVAQLLHELPEGSSVDSAIEQAEIQLKAHEDARRVALQEVGEHAELLNQRLLRLPVAGGELLLDADRLPAVAQAWSGEGPIWLTRGALWSEPLKPGLSLVAGLHGEGFMIQNPLAASTPEPLRKLLRPEPIEVRVLGRVEESEPRDWSWGSTQASYRLDKGSADGLYAGMHMAPVAEGEFWMSIESVERDSAVGVVYLSRFSAKDTVKEPLAGDRYTSRRQGGREACGIDTSAAVRAAITAVRVLDESKADADGFQWFEVDIDHGSRSGLELEQALTLEGGDHASGESRLRGLGADTSTLLWRVHSRARQDDTALPEVGGYAVTRAWQRASEELFGF